MKTRTIQISAGSIKLGDKFINVELNGTETVSTVKMIERNGHWMTVQLANRAVHQMGATYKVIVRRK